MAAGSRSVTEPTELSFGDRVSRVRDPWGNLWWIHTHVADPDPEELGRLAANSRNIETMHYVQTSLEEELSRGCPVGAPLTTSESVSIAPVDRDHEVDVPSLPYSLVTVRKPGLTGSS